MIKFDPYILPSAVASEMYRRSKHCFYNGTYDRKVLNHCTGLHAMGDVVTILIFTRDIGHHTGGMFRNPDYERCYHLSISFRDAITGEHIPYEKKIAKMWVETFFSQDDLRKLWVESPKSEEGKRNDVWHYRLFCDEQWRGILPRKEVYSEDFTELDWKSFSEIHGEPDPIMAGWGET